MGLKCTLYAGFNQSGDFYVASDSSFLYDFCLDCNVVPLTQSSCYRKFISVFDGTLTRHVACKKQGFLFLFRTASC